MAACLKEELLSCFSLFQQLDPLVIDVYYNLHVISANTHYGQRCLQYKGSVLWNNLPNFLKKNNMTVNRF